MSKKPKKKPKPKAKPKAKVAPKPVKRKPKPPADPRVEKVYEKEIRFYCPVRGWVTQKVKVTKFKSMFKMAEERALIKSSTDPLDDFEELDLNTAYGATEEPE